MTSELRPAVETRAEVLDQLLSELQDGNAWDSTISLLADYADLVQDLLKDREAVRAEQAAEVERLTQCLAKANASMEEYERKFYLADDELAKFKALAETLAGALEAIRSEAQREEGSWLHLKRCIAAQSAEALREYKEARDV